MGRSTIEHGVGCTKSASCAEGVAAPAAIKKTGSPMESPVRRLSEVQVPPLPRLEPDKSPQAEKEIGAKQASLKAAIGRPDVFLRCAPKRPPSFLGADRSACPRTQTLALVPFAPLQEDAKQSLHPAHQCLAEPVLHVDHSVHHSSMHRIAWL